MRIQCILIVIAVQQRYMDDKEYREWLDGYSEHGMDFETWKKRVEKKSTFDIIKADKTVSGHSGTPKMAEVGMVIDHIGKDGKVDVRAFYGESKLKIQRYPYNCAWESQAKILMENMGNTYMTIHGEMMVD